jgi:hypothetical protein
MSPNSALLTKNDVLAQFIRHVNGVVLFNFEQHTGAIKAMFENLRAGDKGVEREVRAVIARTILTPADAAFFQTSSLRQSDADDNRRRCIRKKIARVFARLQAEIKMRFAKENPQREGEHSHVMASPTPRKRTLEFSEQFEKSIHGLINKNRAAGPEKVACMRQLFRDAERFLAQQLEQFEDEAEADRATCSPSTSSGATDSEGVGLGLDVESE